MTGHVTAAEVSMADEPDMVFAEDSNNEQSEFDMIVGCIEDIVIGEKFQDLQVPFTHLIYVYRIGQIPQTHVFL